MTDLQAILLYLRLAFYTVAAFGCFVRATRFYPERRHVSRQAVNYGLMIHFLVLVALAVIRIAGGDFLLANDYAGTPAIAVVVGAVWWSVLSVRERSV